MTDKTAKIEVVNKIFEYFQELGFQNIVFYGSYIEQMNGFDVVPNDIDVCIVMDEEPPEKRHKTFYLGFTDLPINVEFMHRKSFEAELKSMQPKYFMYISNPALHKDIDSAFQSKELHEVRSCISSVSSKAFDKGKKKLTVENDYDEVLGLKNIYHAFKFLYYAKWYYYPEMNPPKEAELQFLNEIHKNIYEIYQNSTGTLDERCKVLLNYVKGLYNTQMTGFRILFPKQVNT
ncbi:hypothetical protein GAP32_124 [Cronobacter phage vB_CsaM_GAP32]|uniref:Uncharacterized protein n=1 Tax=Cronobacter phage vB_CsaM_GAP32 TaxID=1141136 RepID=K4F6K5_9CAUD|nr:hypothetical protein GAP32_124 [Cronobacter phage vB_CsaM_GAP32]AFC21573.1 hypothetical protein GAP32_124 [Cronobacter phage vB_CsaM_GAP32]